MTSKEMFEMADDYTAQEFKAKRDLKSWGDMKGKGRIPNYARVQIEKYNNYIRIQGRHELWLAQAAMKREAEETNRILRDIRKAVDPGGWE